MKMYITTIRMALFFVLMSSITVFAQPLNMELLKGMEPRNIGPAGMSGRITAIDAVVSNPDIIYVGSASGGLWKSTTGGVTWTPIFDNEKAASIGAVNIYQKNPDVIWVGTGEGNPRNSQTSGAGVYKSIDGGRSWQFMGLEKTRNIHRVIIHPDNPDVVYVGAQGSAWGDSEDRGVFKTTDGGKTWKKILYNNTRTGIGDMVMDPVNPDKIFAAMWEFRRWPWTFKSGGEGSGLYVTMDGGETWKNMTSDDGFPKGELGRIGVAIARNKPNVVYALVESEKNALYRSTDGGFSWEMREEVAKEGDIGGRPFYYHELYVDPQNENRIFSIHTFITLSEDGGKTFESIYPYYNWVHPDHHAFWINPEDPSLMYDGNDGGFNISRDGGKTWRFIENIPVGQFYHVNVDMEFPYNVYGGMQDNGSWQGPAYVLRAGGIRNSYWEELFFGDGFDAVVDPSDSRYVYAMSQGGNVGRVDRITGQSQFVQPTHPDGENLRFNWNAAINIDPFDSKTVYFGSQFVHKSTDRGYTWTIISPDLTTNDPEKQKQHESGGLTMDATGAENFTTIIAIEPSPVERGVIWVGTDDGNIQVTRDGGQTWTNTTKNVKGVPAGSWVAQIKASKFNNGEAFAVINDYRRDNWAPYLMHTTDYGKSWKNLVSSKGLEGYMLSFVQDLEEPRLMFAGTEFGLYVSIDGGTTWTKWKNGYPTVSTYDMVIHPREHDLVIGTFGRSFWVLDDVRPLRAMAKTGAKQLEKAIAVYPAPDAYQFATRQAGGIRFSADGMFEGANRPNGAMLTYSINTGALAEKEDGKAEGESENSRKRVKIEIFDTSGENIRTYEITAANEGINRTFWNMSRKGVRNPSRQKPRPNAPEPQGGPVLPGTYKVKMTYGGQSDSTMVTVNTDPRLNVNITDLHAIDDFRRELDEVRTKLADAVDPLLEAREVIEAAERLTTVDGRPRNQKTDITKLNKDTKQKVDDLLNMVFGKPDNRQGITRSPERTVSSYLFAPNRYLGGAAQRPGATEQNLLRLAREKVDEAVQQINEFVNTDWPAYVQAMKAANLDPFKEIKSGGN